MSGPGPEEDWKAVLAGELAGLADLGEVASLEARRMKQTLRARVPDAKGFLGRHIPQARQILRKLLVELTGFEPVAS